jgi:integrase
MTVQQIPSGRLLDAHSNLERFIAKARNEVAAFGPDLDFDAPFWDVTPSARKRFSASSQKLFLYFTTHEGGSSKSMAGRTPLTDPFASFVKAIVRIRYEANPKKPDILTVLIRAARYLHDVLTDRGSDPCVLTAADFQAAANACRSREAESSRYRVGMYLAEIADWLNRYAISKARIDFPNPFPRVAYDHTRVGKEHDRRRNEKMPPPMALEALGQISNLVDHPPDIVRMRAVELLASAGFRINELLTIPEDCEVEEDAIKNGKPILDRQGTVVRRYGLRYWPEKGAAPDTKWFPTAMVDVAKRAVRDIRLHSAEARTVARWLEKNPGRGFLTPQDDLGPDQLFSSRDLERMFNLSEKSGVKWAKTRGVSACNEIDRTLHYRRRDIEAALLADQRFPDPSSLKLSEYLFLVPLNFCHDEKATNPCVVSILTDQQIRDFLTRRRSSRGATRPVFDRFGFTMPDGSPIQMTSHMFRHWLNTLAQQGGMNQHEIARWFGRKDAEQNAPYDHVTGAQLAEEVRSLMENGHMRGGMASIHDALPPVARENFREMAVPTAHTTDLGMCVTDWSLALCPDHGSCARCGDHLVIKGDARQMARAETMLEEQQWLLAGAIQEAEEETYGASNYVTHIRSVVDGLRNIVDVHKDPSVPKGMIVHANPTMPSRRGQRRLEEATIG